MTSTQRFGVAIASMIVLWLIASLRVPSGYWASPSGHFDLLGIVGMSIAVASGKRHQKPIGPVFRGLAAFVALLMGLSTALFVHDALFAIDPPEGSLALADYFGLITAFFAYGAVRGKNWF